MGSLSFPKAPKLFFFSSPGRISCVWRADPVRSLWLFGAEAGFPPLAFPQSKEGENPHSNTGNPSDLLGGIFFSSSFSFPKSSHQSNGVSLSPSNSLNRGGSSTSFRWHACVQQTQHCALWLRCVLFRPSLVATLSPLDIALCPS